MYAVSTVSGLVQYSRLLHHLAWIGSVILWLLVNLGALAATNDVVLRGTVHPNFARLVFNWNEAITYRAAVENRQLVIYFDKPINTTLTPILESLDDYIIQGRIGSNQKTVSFDLRQSYTLRSFRTSPSILVFDLLETSNDNAKSSMPVAIPHDNPVADKAIIVDFSSEINEIESKPTVQVRFGQHKGFSRLVFDWPVASDYNIDREGNQTKLLFDQQAKIALGPLQSERVRNVNDAQFEVQAEGVQVALNIPAAAKLRHFRSGNKVVLDIFDILSKDKSTQTSIESILEQNTKAALRDSQIASIGQQQTGVVPARLPTGTLAIQQNLYKNKVQARALLTNQLAQAPLIAPSSTQPPVPLDNRPPTTQQQLVAPPPEQTPQRLTQSPPSLPIIQQPGTQKETPSTQIPVPQQPNRTSTFQAVPAVSAPPRSLRKQASSGNVFEGNGIDIGRFTVPTRSLRVRRGSPIKVEYAHGKDGAILVFRTPEVEALAVFRQKKYLYIVFGSEVQIDWNNLEENQVRWLGSPDMESFDQKDRTIIRLELLRPDLQPTVTLDSFVNWIIQLEPRPTRLREQASFKEGSGPNGREYLFTGTPGPAIQFDLESDSLSVVPIAESGFGVSQRKRTSEFSLFPSAQGLVIRRLNPSITVQATDNGTRIYSLSTIASDAKADSTTDPEAEEKEEEKLARIFPLEQWRRDPQISFNDHIAALRTTVSEQANRPAAQNNARLQLAQFLFAHGLYPETLSVISRIVMEDNENYFLNDRIFQAMRGASQMMVGNAEAAKGDIDIPELDGEEEADLWRGLVAGELGEFEKASKLLANSFRWIEAYPHLARMHMYVRMAESGLQSGKTETTSLAIDAMNQDDPTESYYGRGRVLRARQLAQDGQLADAISEAEDVANFVDQPTYAYANYFLTEYKFENRDIEPKEAIDRFEQLQWAWKDKRFQFNVLTRLGELYRDEGRYRWALQSFRSALIAAPGASKASAVESEMRRLFTDLFLNDKADSLPPLTALAMYDEFRELTPIGAEGDRMIRKLAERLVSVDLLERAAILLQHQIKFRMAGSDAARVGLDLAKIRLDNQQPEQALAALDQTNMKGLDVNLVDARRLVQAQALSAIGRPNAALDLLESDLRAEADEVRTVIAWKAEDWEIAAESYERLLEPDPLADFKLDRVESDRILRWAIALSLGRNYDDLSMLQRRFGDYMLDGDDSDAFKLITTGIANRDQPRSISQELAEIANFESFLESFREQLRLSEREQQEN